MPTLHLLNSAPASLSRTASPFVSEKPYIKVSYVTYCFSPVDFPCLLAHKFSLQHPLNPTRWPLSHTFSARAVMVFPGLASADRCSYFTEKPKVHGRGLSFPLELLCSPNSLMFAHPWAPAMFPPQFGIFLCFVFLVNSSSSFIDPTQKLPPLRNLPGSLHHSFHATPSGPTEGTREVRAHSNGANSDGGKNSRRPLPRARY